MIIEKKSGLDIDSNVVAINATISDASLPFIFRLLSENFYSNPLGSMIREITSNCIDSHTEALVDVPVVLWREYSQEDRRYYIIFEDFGVGLSTDRIMSIFMDYGNSSKRTSNELVGGFGLGSKSPLSYQESFSITTRFDGKQYEYIYSRGDLKPSIISVYGYDEVIVTGSYYDEDAGIDIPTEEVTHIPIGMPTELGNGTQIRIQIKTEDNYKVEEEIKKQLCYFNNIEFKGFSGLSSDYTIYELRTFLYRTDVSYSSGKLHIVLGQVAYPLNFNTLGIGDIYIPIGLKFEIGELQVTPNREELIYSKKTIELIKQRIEEMKIELSNLANSQSEITSIDEYIKLCQATKIPVKLTEGVVLEINKSYLPAFDYVFTPVPEIKYISKYIYSPFYQHVCNIFSHTYVMTSPRNSESYKNVSYRYSEMIVDENDEESPIEKYNLAYLRQETDLTDTGLVVFREISKKNLSKDTLYQQVSTMLSIPNVKKYIGRDAQEYWKVIANRKIVGKFISYLLATVKKNSIRFSDNIPSKEWIAKYKEDNKVVRIRKPKVSEELTTFNYLRLTGRTYSTDLSTMTYGEIKQKETVVYCLHGLSVSTSERNAIDRVINFIGNMTDCKRKERFCKQVNKKLFFMSISNTAFEALKAKGLTENFIYYQDMFQIPLLSRLPQKVHLIKNYVKFPKRASEMYSTLSSYGSFFKTTYARLELYIRNLGFESVSYAVDIDLNLYNLPYELKDDVYLKEISDYSDAIYKNNQSKASIELLQKYSYSVQPRLITLILLHSQIKRLTKRYYSNDYLKTVL